VACDALVSEVCPADRMSFGQSLMEATRSVALLVYGLSFGFLEDLGDYQYVVLFAIISGLCFFPTFFALPLGALEGSRHHVQKKGHAKLKCSDFQRLLTPYAMLLMWLLFTNAFATASKVLCVQLFLKDNLHVSNPELGYYATAGNVGSRLGSFFYGWLSHAHTDGKIPCLSRYQLDKFNLILACLGQSGVLVAMTFVPDFMTYGLFFILQFFWSGWMIYSRALVLNYCPPGIAGSFAAVMFAAPNAGQVTGPMAAGGMSSKVGPVWALVITAILFGIPGFFSFFYFVPKELPSLGRQTSTVTETDVDSGKEVIYEKLDDDVIIAPIPDVARVGINAPANDKTKKTRAVNSKSRG